MALLNRPLTEDEARRVLDDWRSTQAGAFMQTFWDALSEPTPHVVHTYYENGELKTRFVPPEEFCIQPGDCNWFVPGTERKK